MKKVIQTSYHKGHYTCAPKEIEDTPMYCEQECGCEDPCDDGCPLGQLDTDCVFYHKDTNQISQLKCLKLKNGVSLTRILELIDSKLCGCGGLPHISDINLSCLESKYGTIASLVEFFEKVDGEICKIYDAIKLVSDTTSGAIINITKILDELEDVLIKISEKLCTPCPSITITTHQSNTISWATTSGPNYNLIAQVRRSADAGNIIQERPDGLYATAPIVLQIDEKVKTSSTDPTAGYLNTKIIGCQENNYIKTVVSQNLSNQMQVCTQLDVIQLLTYIRDNPGAKALFCEIVASCTTPTPTPIPTPIPIPIPIPISSCICHAGVIATNSAFEYIDCNGIQYAGIVAMGDEICFDTSFPTTNVNDLGVSVSCECNSLPTPIPIPIPAPISGTIVAPQDPLIIGFADDNRLFKFDVNTNTSIPLLNLGGFATDVAHTSDKLWIAIAAGEGQILEYDITLSPWTATFNRTITVPGFDLNEGLYALNNTTLISSQKGVSPNRIIQLDITTTTAAISPLFTLSASAPFIAGDIIRTLSGKFIITAGTGSPQLWYLSQYTAGGVLEVNVELSELDPLIDNPRALFNQDGDLYIGSENGLIFQVGLNAPYSRALIGNRGISNSGASNITTFSTAELIP